MTKNMNIPFKDWKGEDIEFATKNESGEVVNRKQMIGDTIAKLLYEMCDSQQMQLSGDEKLQAYRIACRIGKDASNVELSAEDIVLLKRLLLPVLSIGGYGQVIEVLEG